MAFDGQTVVVTGVGRKGQVGEVVAELFAKRGASVALIDRLADEVEERAAAIRELGSEASAHVCDLTDDAQLRTVATDVGARAGGKVAALVNLAGGFAPLGPVAESDPGVWQRMFAINLTTAYLTTRAFLPLLRAGRGAIVFFGAAAALPGAKVKELSGYAAAKGGVLTLMRAVAEEERATGVRANAVAPTAVRTATNIASMGENVRYVEREEVAEVVAWLCSYEARAVTGQTILL